MTRNDPAEAGPNLSTLVGAGNSECTCPILDLVRRRLHEIDLAQAANSGAIAEHEARLVRLEADVIELRDRRIDPARDPETVAAGILELIDPSAAERLAAAVLVAADDLGVTR